jgi:hypothetical protein
MKSEDKLTLKDIPEADARWRRGIDLFAYSYDGYKHKNCAKLANATKKTFEKKKQIPKSLTLNQLRTCLFFEQRRWRHFEKDPDAENMFYIRSLVEAIREKVARS